MANTSSQHIDRVLSVGLGKLSQPQALHEKSWARCMQQYGLDPSRPSPARILPQHLLREHQQRMEGLMQVARAGMEDLYRRVADLGYMLLLTDAEGITVDYIGNPASERQLKAAGLYKGADWNEAHAGTCGVGTCLVEQTTITCHQTEHFDATHIALTCTAAPLLAPDGQMLGVLDVSALHSPEARESQHLVRQLTTIYAQQIEDANFLRSFARHRVLRLGSVPGLVEVSGELMFALDDDGLVLGANGGARRRFAGAAGSGLLGRPVIELLDISPDALRKLGAHGGSAALAGSGSALLAPLHGIMIPPRRAGRANSARPDPARTALDQLLGDDPTMRSLVERAKRLVDKRVNLLISGETGSGKEVLARALHASSARASKAFVAVNCAAIPESLIESELFGYTPGSFTGGKSKGMKGLIAQADGGTLFLDEIGDMPLGLQTRLLRVLSESEVLPLGAERPVALDLNVISATHQPLREAVQTGRFREDLFYRLSGATLALLPLRERADKAWLIERLFAQEAAQQGAENLTLAPAALQCLLSHDWPGNVRELRNALRYAIALASGPVLRQADLPDEVCRLAPRLVVTTGPSVHDTEASQLLAALSAHRWRISSAARALGLCRATLYRQMKRHGITPPNQRL